MICTILMRFSGPSNESCSTEKIASKATLSLFLVESGRGGSGLTSGSGADLDRYIVNIHATHPVLDRERQVECSSKIWPLCQVPLYMRCILDSKGGWTPQSPPAASLLQSLPESNLALSIACLHITQSGSGSGFRGGAALRLSNMSYICSNLFLSPIKGASHGGRGLLQ